jgi:hypothetical protein
MRFIDFLLEDISLSTQREAVDEAIEYDSWLNNQEY